MTILIRYVEVVSQDSVPTTQVIGTRLVEHAHSACVSVESVGGQATNRYVEIMSLASDPVVLEVETDYDASDLIRAIGISMLPGRCPLILTHVVDEHIDGAWEGGNCRTMWTWDLSPEAVAS